MSIYKIKLESKQEVAAGTMAPPIYYVAGPQTMVHAMHEILSKAGVDDDNIRTEEFSGY